jgi:hypothetical protein
MVEAGALGGPSFAAAPFALPAVFGLTTLRFA